MEVAIGVFVVIFIIFIKREFIDNFFVIIIFIIIIKEEKFSYNKVLQ